MRGFKIITVESGSLEPSFFETPDNSKQESFLSFPSPQSNTVIELPQISRNIRFYEPIFVSLGSSKNRDSTVILE